MSTPFTEVQPEKKNRGGNCIANFSGIPIRNPMGFTTAILIGIPMANPMEIPRVIPKGILMVTPLPLRFTTRISDRLPMQDAADACPIV